MQLSNKPRLIGVVWADENGNKPELCSSLIWMSLNNRAMIFPQPPVMTEPEKKEKEIASPVQEKKVSKRIQINEDQIKDLIKLVHGNRHKREFMIKEFQAFEAKQASPDEAPVEYTKASIKEQIDKIAECKVIEIEGKKKKRLCWMVAPDILKQYGLEDFGDVHRWEYILPPQRKLDETATQVDSTESKPPGNEHSKKHRKEEKSDSAPIKKKKKKKNLPAITKFTKVLSKEDDTNASTTEVSKSKEENRKSIETSKSEENLIKLTPVGRKSELKKFPAAKKRVPLLMSARQFHKARKVY